MSRKLAIFPIDHQTVTFARYAHLGDFEPIALVSPALSVIEGSDISKLDGGKKTNIHLYTDYQQKICESDVVYFVDSKSIKKEDLYHELIEYANELNKEVIVSDYLSKRLKELRDLELPSPKLLPIDFPIISILTMGGEYCGQAETEFSLGRYFRDQGYQVLQIGTQEYSHLLGFLNLPDFLFNTAIDAQKKILMFNKFVYESCKQEKPDVIILGVPHPIMKYNNEILNGLGIIPFIVQNSIESDIGVVNLHFNEYSHDYFNDITNLCKYRLNVEATYFGISNVSATKNMDEVNKLEYLHIDSEFVKDNLNEETGKGEYTLFAINDEETRTEVFRKIEQELLTNISSL